MSKDAQKSRKIPAAVLKAQAALEILRGENLPLAEEIEKVLPVYAVQKDKAGETVTVEELLEAARQGADYLKENTPAKNRNPAREENVFETYARLTGRNPPANDDNRTEHRPVPAAKDTLAAAAARGDNDAVR